MNTFKATKEGIFLDGLKIQAWSEYSVHIGPDGDPPEVVLRISCGHVDIIGEDGR